MPTIEELEIELSKAYKMVDKDLRDIFKDCIKTANKPKIMRIRELEHKYGKKILSVRGDNITEKILYRNIDKLKKFKDNNVKMIYRIDNIKIPMYKIEVICILEDISLWIENEKQHKGYVNNYGKNNNFL